MGKVSVRVWGSSMLAGLAILVLVLGLIAARAVAPGGYNVYSTVLADMGRNASNFPHCDSGETFFLTQVFEWASGGRMVTGQTCQKGAVSAEIVAQWVEKRLLEQGIDPMVATPEEIETATNVVLQEWANGLLGR